jgi:hypothetical protein
MPSMVGGFGNKNSNLFLYLNNNSKIYDYSNFNSIKSIATIDIRQTISTKCQFNLQLGSYLAGLIEGDGTFASTKHRGLAPISGVRYFSSSTPNDIKPVMVYSNSDTQKLEILRDNKNKSGIYR